MPTIKHEEQFEALFQHSTEGILVVDKAGIIQLINPAAEKMFGYNHNELLKQQVEVLIPQRFHNHKELRDKFNEHPQARSMGAGRDLYGLTKTGEQIPIEISLSPYSTKEGSFVIAFIIDISIRKKNEEAIKQQKGELEKLTLDLEKRVQDRTLILEEALQQLESSRAELTEALAKEKELNELKSRFVSMASHEFRTPLAAILSSLSLVSKYAELGNSEKQEHHIQRIKNSVSNMTELLNDVLSLSKLEEGKVEIHLENFLLQDFAESVLQELHGLLKKEQNIVYKHEGAAAVNTDKKVVRIILFNLISNAIKFSTEGKTITLHTSVQDGLLTITVQDQGIGISEEDKEHLFERFFRGKNVTNIQGTGLGLSIILRYIELLQGNVDVQSELQKGTTITIQIPNV